MSGPLLHLKSSPVIPFIHFHRLPLHIQSSVCLWKSLGLERWEDIKPYPQYKGIREGGLKMWWCWFRPVSPNSILLSPWQVELCVSLYNILNNWFSMSAAYMMCWFGLLRIISSGRKKEVWLNYDEVRRLRHHLPKWRWRASQYTDRCWDRHTYKPDRTDKSIYGDRYHTSNWVGI